jgi:hypothetical protein
MPKKRIPSLEETKKKLGGLILSTRKKQALSIKDVRDIVLNAQRKRQQDFDLSGQRIFEYREAMFLELMKHLAWCIVSAGGIPNYPSWKIRAEVTAEEYGALIMIANATNSELCITTHLSTKIGAFQFRRWVPNGKSYVETTQSARNLRKFLGYEPPMEKTDARDPIEEALCMAGRIHLSPHEWTWTHDEQVSIAKALLQLSKDQYAEVQKNT